MKRIRDEHDCKRNNQNPRGTLVRIACARVTVNEKCLHDHKEANAKQRVIAAVLQNVCVGISLATGEDHSVQEIVATVANNFVWYFYTPALILLGLSGYKRKE